MIRLEARDDFPERLRAERPDIVFNIAEGLRGPNREAHVPAICEFYGVPYSGSDPFTLALCLDKARTKEILRANGVPTADWSLVARRRRRSTRIVARGVELSAVREAGARGLVQGNHGAQPRRATPTRSRAIVARAPRALRAAGDRRDASCPAPSSPAACSGTAPRRACCPLVGMNFDVAARRRAADLRLRGEVDLGPPGESARHLLVPGADLRRAARRDRRRRPPRLRRARLPRLVAHRRSPRRARARRTSSR